MTAPTTILICTVGGSHEPILRTIQQLCPEFVCFVCSDRDPATGRPGSRRQISGKGNVIKAHPDDETETLPSIPVQINLDEDRYEVVVVPADDLDAAFTAIRDSLQRLLQRSPDPHIVADYTGGTKTMTAALVTAVLESDRVDLRLVTGARSDLGHVVSGSEESMSVVVERIRLERQTAPFLAAWSRHAYDEAENGLRCLSLPSNQKLRGWLVRARDLSAAFAAWDRFEHASALRLLDLYRPVIASELGSHLQALGLITGGADRCEPARILDLARNAERRAAQGRYDDAVGRLYRVLEWTAQWLLRTRCGIDTADVPAGRLPPGLSVSAGADGKRPAGLHTAWRLVGALLPGTPAGEFFAREESKLQNHLQARNASILAHGFTPVTAAAWGEFSTWFEAAYVPALEAEARRAGVRTRPPQLPIRFPRQTEPPSR